LRENHQALFRFHEWQIEQRAVTLRRSPAPDDQERRPQREDDGGLLFGVLDDDEDRAQGSLTLAAFRPTGAGLFAIVLNMSWDPD